MKLRKILKKFFATYLILLLLFNPLFATKALAEDLSPIPVPTEEPIPTLAFVSPAPDSTTPVPTDTPVQQTPTPNTVVPTETPTVSVPTPTFVSPGPDTTPSPTDIIGSSGTTDLTVTPTIAPDGQSTINSGDANASSDNSNSLNSNTDNINGSVSTDGSCPNVDGQTSCPNDINIANDNSATLSATATSSATTGDNDISGTQRDASINTGDATASGQISNDVNNNQVVLSGSVTPTLVPQGGTSPSSGESSGYNPESSTPENLSSGTPAPVQIPSPTPDLKTLTVDNNNNADVSNNADISASTGSNTGNNNLGNVDLNTGDATAMANLVNLLNTNVVGSNFELFVLNINGSGLNEINLNDAWKQLEEKMGGSGLYVVGDVNSSNMKLFISNENNANLTNNVNVSAGTGNNDASGNNNSATQTGNTQAIANVVNFTNTNILGSKFFLGIITVTGQFDGNLILPRPEFFSNIYNYNYLTKSGSTMTENQNTAEINNTVNSTADTGGNQANGNSGSSTVTTGDATSTVNSLNVANTDIRENDWFYLSLNALGGWSGDIYGWSSPESRDQQRQACEVYQITPEEVAYQAAQPPGSDIVRNENISSINNNINVSATTGGNKANENQGNAKITTGNALSVANLLNFTNLNVLGSRFFMGLVNIAGKWNGKAIFAYADVSVFIDKDTEKVFPGEDFNYILSYQNIGYDNAKETLLKIVLPAGVEYISDNNTTAGDCANQVCFWKIGELKRNQGGLIKIKVRLSPDYIFDEKLTFWDILIPKVFAAEDGQTLITRAQIETQDPESDTNNNSASIVIMAVQKPTGGEDNLTGTGLEQKTDQRQPTLEISAKNNVNGFVYHGDTVTFELTIKNTGEVPVYNAKLIQEVYDGTEIGIGKASIPIGTIQPGKSGKLTFGVKLENEQFIADDYHTIARAEGNAPNGDKVSSNEGITYFVIKDKNPKTLIRTAGLNTGNGTVLGEGKISSTKTSKEKVWPYILLFVISSAMLVIETNEIIERRELSYE